MDHTVDSKPLGIKSIDFVPDRTWFRFQIQVLTHPSKEPLTSERWKDSPKVT